MFGNYVYEKASGEYSDRIILIDEDNLCRKYNLCGVFSQHGFQIIHYIDDLDLRVNHSDAISGEGKYVLLVRPGSYVPFDVCKRFRAFTISISSLFPRLNAAVIKEAEQINYDLLYAAYKENFKDLKKRPLTEQFIKSKVYGKENVQDYLSKQNTLLCVLADQAKTYQDWINLSHIKTEVDLLATEHEVAVEASYIDNKFANWIVENFGKLSSIIDRNSPVLVSKAMEFMHDQSDKFVIIVMDGMSQFDWQILSTGFDKLHYGVSSAYAMIPTVTSVSRQCLLSNKYPLQLQEPWKQSKEKNEFIDCALSLGYERNQVDYQRGYDADFGAFVKCGAVIINEIDDMVHGQGQGRIGMFNDVSVMKKQAKLYTLVQRLLKKGFDVYISADHGNTPCVGDGRLMGTGLETETKSRRMLVLRDFADKHTLEEKYNMIEFPKYYLPKEFDYLICAVGHSFDTKDDEVMNHGGISIDEVIVPFITIKAGENNG